MYNIDLERRLKDIILKCGKICDVIIYDNTNLQDDLGFNSLNFMDLIIQIEEEFSVEIDDENLLLENLITYGRLLKLLRELVKNSESGK